MNEHLVFSAFVLISFPASNGASAFYSMVQVFMNRRPQRKYEGGGADKSLAL
jgi:hypothetical protein